MLNLNKNTLQM